MELLSLYKFRIKYKSDKDNSRADTLSRRSDIMNGYKDRSYNILRQNKDNLLSPNSNIMAVTVIIKNEVE